MSGSTPTPSTPAASTASTAQPPITQPLENANLWRGVVSVCVMGAFAAAEILTMTKTVPDTAIVHDALGILGTLATTVVVYWVGSSAGSTSKSNTIAQMATAPNPASNPPPTPGPTSQIIKP